MPPRLVCVIVFAAIALLGAPDLSAAASEGTVESSFPLPLDHYQDASGTPLLEILRQRIAAHPFNLVATIVFALAIAHTFLATKFMHLAHRWRDEHAAKIRATNLNSDLSALPGARTPVSFKAEAMHFFGEVKAIFGIWVVPLIVVATVLKGLWAFSSAVWWSTAACKAGRSNLCSRGLGQRRSCLAPPA